MATKKNTQKKSSLALTPKERAELAKAGKAAKADAKKKGITNPDEYFKDLKRVN